MFPGPKSGQKILPKNGIFRRPRFIPMFYSKGGTVSLSRWIIYNHTTPCPNSFANQERFIIRPAPKTPLSYIYAETVLPPSTFGSKSGMSDKMLLD